MYFILFVVKRLCSFIHFIEHPSIPLLRDKMQVEKKAMVSKMEEDDNDKRKEIGIIKAQLQKVCFI